MLEILFKGLFDTDFTNVISITDFITCLFVSLIIGILMTIGIVSVIKVIKSSNEEFDKTQYENFLESAQIYFRRRRE